MGIQVLIRVISLLWNIELPLFSLRNFSTTTNGSKWLHDNWRLCDPVSNSSDVDKLFDFLTNMYTTLAMVNYPFSSDFLMPLPANPVRVVCQYLNKKLNGTKLLQVIKT